QYTDATGKAAYASAYGGSYVDTSTAIVDHCSSQYSGTSVHVGTCVLNSDIQAEVAHAISVNHWTATATSIFFVFTPKNIGSCMDTTSHDCAYTSYCAYHSYYSSAGMAVLYANQ